MTTAFPPDVVAAICRHMSQDHAEDGLLIVRTLGGRPDAVSATAVDVDGAGMRFEVVDDAGTVEEVAVAFAEPATERADVRTAVVELHRRALARAAR